jgi:hypothetical protein
MITKSLIYLTILLSLLLLVTVTVLTVRYSTELQEKDITSAAYQKIVSQWRDSALAHPISINIQTNTESSQMTRNDSSKNVNIGNNTTVTGSTINLGNINGSVTNAINQLLDSDSNQVNLKDLFTQLQTAIESDVSLPDDDKADLLEQVQNLAEAINSEEPAKKEGVVRKAKKIFDATLKNLPDTAKIVEACSTLLPLILKVLGVPVP